MQSVHYIVIITESHLLCNKKVDFTKKTFINLAIDKIIKLCYNSSHDTLSV